MAAPKRTAIRARLCTCRPPVKPREQLRSGSILARRQIDRRIFASSIDFNIEFEPVAFIEALHARTFDRTDMDECVRLAIVTGDETEALHPVEEFNRASCPLTSQLTLRRFLLLHGDDVADNDQVACRNLATAIDQREFELLPFGQTFKTSALNRADVNEHILAARILLDEAESLVRVEELDRALALANDLRGHSATTAAGPTWCTAAAAEAIAATRRTAITTAEAARARCAEAISTAAETVTATHEWIETVLAETVPLVPALAATSSIETHKSERTFASPKS